jgi:hypothetical protein
VVVNIGDNQYTVDAARVAAEANGTRDLTEAKQRELDRQAAIEIARINTDIKVRNVPSVSGPPLTSSNDTCMGSTSGSANVPGIGIGFGTTWTDQNCKMLKNSRELWNMGMKAAALALMCSDAANKEALEVTGFVCPTKDNKSKSAAAPVTSAAPAASADRPDITDPYIRARLGLTPLK